MKISNLSLVILCGLFLSSCSVFMAASGSGVDATTLSKCKTRSCLISEGAKPTSQKSNKNGGFVYETFSAQLPTGSVARAAMHGVLDVSTLGLWEVAGTPIEAVQDRKKYYTVKVNYQPDGETIKSFQLMS